ncbi:MAG TPA: HAD-IIIA family hydrolase [Chitinophagaceae bacterium]|jgi:D-glycero-alpha-D-manno-heptose 1-phosphate guanylyltransferase|nr:HAD-IIIA family hydrolase [Chitinophagaceae bacterium]
MLEKINSSSDLSSHSVGGEAIVLAGGLGTRLRDAVPDLPKCMAPVADQPFLKHVIRYLFSQGIEKFIFSLGYKHEIIQKFLEDQFPTLNYQCSIEKEPLGTGGAIQLACKRVVEDNVVVVNGDSLFKADIHKASLFHVENNAECTLMLKPMENFDRYGVVELDNDGSVRSFKEKRFFKHGDINAGIYILNIESFLDKGFPERFSFEKDYLEKYYPEKKIFGVIHDNYFIDIGIPEDYKRAQEELKQIPLQLENVNTNWTLFLDRDGVINYEKENSYILNWNEFEFYPDVTEAISLLAKKFNTIVVISNQRGVGRGLMTEEDLLDIQQRMKSKIEKEGGRIDKIYYCTASEDTHFYRKPNPGMALQAAKDFPFIDFSKSVMIGNKLSDMQFGRNAGTYTVYLKTTHPNQPLPHPDIDLAYHTLLDFAKAL